MNDRIKLNRRQPTWNYILNDLALYSLMAKVIHSEEATNQEKFDFMYQIELLQQENARLKDKLTEIKKVIDGYMPNEHAMCKAFDEIEFILKGN